MESKTHLRTEAFKVWRGKVLKENHVAVRAWSSSKLVLLKNNTTIAVGMCLEHFSVNISIISIDELKSMSWLTIDHTCKSEKTNPANIYLFEVNNRNSCEICSKLTIKTPERLDCSRSGVFILNFEHILKPFSSVSIVYFEQVNVSWDIH